MRAATALIALLSVLPGPIVSAICTECCQHSAEHQVTICQDKAHAPLGPHLHHMNHVHMITQGSDASVVVQQCEHQLQDGHRSCQSTRCLSGKPVQASVASVPAHRLQGSSLLVAAAICSCLTTSGPVRPPGAYRIALSSSQSAAAPLRI